MVDVTVAQAMIMPVGVQPAILQFNRTSGAFIVALHAEGIDISTLGAQDLFVYVEDEWDFSSSEVVGNYPDYKVVNKDELPAKVYERNLDALARDKITKRYPVIQQVNVLGRAIMALSKEMGVEQDELEELLDYILEVKKGNQARKEFYAASPDYEYISTEQEDNQQSARLDGGVHELYGPRPTSGGRVFGGAASHAGLALVSPHADQLPAHPRQPGLRLLLLRRSPATQGL